MSPQAQIILLLWLPVILYFFRRYKPRDAVLISFLGGLLFLPQRTGFKLPLIPDYQGMVATCYGIVIGLFLYDSGRFKQFQGKLLDLPMLTWCLCPIFSSLSNGLGLYDGINEAITQSVVWGLPYFLGRLYFDDLKGLKSLAEGIVKGGIIYIPLCLWEGVMSPNCHLIVYGYYAHSSGISQAVRYGGYRPNVFMQHGLMVGMWMMSSALICIWLWQAKTFKRIWNYPLGTLVPVFVFTVIWCRSTGAYGYFMFGLIVLFVAKFVRVSWPLLFLILGLVYYVHINVQGTFDGTKILESLTSITNADRTQSLQFRWDNEAILSEKARQQIWFGWGGWDRNRVYEENWLGEWENISVTDSLWIIAFSTQGMVGLYSLTLAMLLPPFLLCFSRYSAKTWFQPNTAPVGALAVLLTLFMLDCMINSMFNPIFPLISGGLISLLVKSK